MANYQRVHTSLTDEVPVSADAYWTVLLDWAGILKWMRVEGRPVPLVKVELAPGHEVGRLPCTRNCIFDTSALPPGVAIPSCVPETLLHVDPQARFLYYNMEGEGPFGLRNYLATTTVDALGPDRSRITCTGRFDLPEGIPAGMLKGFIENVYDCIVHDIPELIAKQSAR